MRYKELEKMDDAELAYGYLIFSMKYYGRKIEYISLTRTKTDKGRPAAELVVYMKNFADAESNETIWLADDSYLWFLNSVARDFPDTTIIDNTPRYYKSVKK